MDKRVSYTMVGAFVLVLGFLLLASVVWMSSFKHGENYRLYQMYAREDVSGLSGGSSVRFSGVQVGSVEAISINPNDVQEVKIVLKLKESTPITTSTVASLVTEGITGVQFVGLKALKPKAPLLLPSKSNPIPTIPDRPSLFVRLNSMLDSLALQVSQLAKNVNELVTDKNREAVSKTLSHVEVFTGILSQNASRMNDIVAHLDKTMERVDQASQTLPETMKAVNHLAHTMDRVSKQAGDVLSSADGVSEQLSRTVLPNLDQLLQQSSLLANNLKAITDRIRQNPSVLIRGQVPLAKGPGE